MVSAVISIWRLIWAYRSLSLLALFPLFLRLINSIERDELRILLMNLFVYHAHPMPDTLLFVCAMLSTLSALIVLLYSKSRFVQFFSVTYLFLALVLDFSFLKVTGRGLQGPTIGLLIEEGPAYLFNWNLTSQLTNFSSQIQIALLRSVFVVGGIVVSFRFIPARFTLKWLFLLPLSMGITYTAALHNNMEIEFVPSPFKIPLLIGHARAYKHYEGPRDSVVLKAKTEGLRKIVLMVDESVRGDMLSINGLKQATTPYLETVNDRYLNLGTISSVSNCSWSSDLLMRVGTGPQELPDQQQISLKRPSVFQYAKQAGYKVYFLDGQLSEGLAYTLNQQDLTQIDEFVQISPEQNGGNSYNNDRIHLAYLRQILERDEKSFIIFQKFGVHVPWEKSYPPEQAYFQPFKSGLNDPADRQLGLNGYWNGIRWAVDGFFQELLSRPLSDDTGIIYTSDHGQSILEVLPNITHCDWLNPRSSQASVPLLLFGQKLISQYFSGSAELKNSVSQFQIFPTLLVLMGYAEADMQRLYVQPLWYEGKNLQLFASGYIFGTFGFRLNPFQPETLY